MSSNLKKCIQLAKEAVILYPNGDNDLPSHRVAKCFFNRIQTYDVSKVFDRIDAKEGHCLFLVDKKK